MVATADQIIGKINPRLYAANGKELLKKYKSIEEIPAEEVKPQAASYLYSFPEGVEKAKDFNADMEIGYDSASETLEPIYFWLLDLMNNFGLKPEKLIDNFSSTPGSGHFGELGGRTSIMQQQANQLMGHINTVLRSTINIIYDLKEFKIRLQSYDNLKSKDKDIRQAARFSLKQIWMDKVDIQKGNSSVKAMALGQAGFQTLLDAFLIVENESLKDVKGNELDLNERVKRIVKSRIAEFNVWLKESEQELRKRYNLERTYLKSQVNSLKLYSRWAKPYLKAATELEQKDQKRTADFVKVFDTMILELTILGKSSLDPAQMAIQGDLPKVFRDYKGREYYKCILIDFRFRGIPSKVSQGQSTHYAFGGKVQIRFRAYALNEDELKMLDQELDKADLGDVLKLVEGATTESLDQLQKDIEEFLEEKNDEEQKQEEKEKKKEQDINPFMALIGKSGTSKKENKKEKSSEKKEITEIKKDDWYEKNYLRPIASEEATDTLFSLYDIYKKGHRMPSFT
jgi:hypothetical protein